MDQSGKSNGYSNKPKWQEDKNSRFINPYNFVPFEGVCDRFTGQEDKGKLTGYLECRLEVLTPLFIPNTTNAKALQRDGDAMDSHSYDFFSYTNLANKDAKEIRGNPAVPVIPGSEIRGAVRSIFEAAFNGCMSTVEKDRPLVRRAPNSKKPGILRKNQNGEWEVTKCERWMLNTKNGEINTVEKLGYYAKEKYAKCVEGQQIYVKRRDDKFVTRKGHTTENYIVEAFQEYTENTKAQAGFQVGYLHKGEEFQNKHNESVFVEIENGDKIIVSQTDVEKLAEVIRQYQDPSRNLNIRSGVKGWYADYKINEKGTLVYYEGKKDTPIYMSPACISIEVFKQTVGNILKANGEYQPCEKRDELCKACSLFGMAAQKCGSEGKEQGGMRGSRVRFEDAQLIKPPGITDLKKYYLGEVTLPEMGTPKPSAVEFYTIPVKSKGEGPSYGYWTYDYMVNGKRREPLPENRPQLRGRKFYWHSDAWKNFVNNQNKLTSMSQRIRPLGTSFQEDGREQMSFQFRIYFENITNEELGQLHWALSFDKETCAHKIGRAKPFGFGSVRIQADNVYLRQIDEKTGMWSNKLHQWDELFGECSIEKTETMGLLQKIMDWGNRPKAAVCYPSGENKKAGKNSSVSHQWFTGNKEMADGARSNNPQFYKVLPNAEEELEKEDKSDRWLYKLIKK